MSIFAIDIKNTPKEVEFVDQANLIRGGILKDELLVNDESDVLLHMAEKLLIAIYDKEHGEIRRRAQSLMDYLDAKYGNNSCCTVRKALDVLVNI